MYMSFCKDLFPHGARLYPLLPSSNGTGGTGCCNPSIWVEDDGRILVNVRHVEYTLYHSETKRFSHPWGPIQYVHPENDINLRTNNYLGEFNFTQESFSYAPERIDTSALDVKPLWEFIGLEDGRLVCWDGKLFITGVRRDTTTNGQGRMELSELCENSDGTYSEVSRQRIPTPGDKDASYCEKNWMPVIDLPYTYVKWCSPVEVVRYNPDTKKTEQIHLGRNLLNLGYDLRGGSQVLPLGDGEHRFAITHQVDLFQSPVMRRKDARYRHRFVVWDSQWNIVHVSDPFDFLGAEVEFVCGAAWDKESSDLLITFGHQDNTAFLLRVPQKVALDAIWPSREQEPAYIVDCFPFFNEVEVMELRINMLRGKVDKFIITEANQTYAGKPKEFLARKTLTELGLMGPDIEILEITYPENISEHIAPIDRAYSNNYTKSKWVEGVCRERLQRDAMLARISEIPDNSILILSDCDEILDPEYVETYARLVRSNPTTPIKVPLANLIGRADLSPYHTSTNKPVVWNRSMVITTKEVLKYYSPQTLRGEYGLQYNNYVRFEYGPNYSTHGWHFSWMGDIETKYTAGQKQWFDFIHPNEGAVHDHVSKYVPHEGSPDPINTQGVELRRYDVTQLPEEILFNPKFKSHFLKL